MQAFLISENSAEPYLNAISKATYGIAFLATPHIGTDKAAWTDFATKFLRLEHFNNYNHALLETLSPGSKNLAKIEDQFLTAWRRRSKKPEDTFHLLNFHEEYPVTSIGKVGFLRKKNVV
jgi:hypothetical protein